MKQLFALIILAIIFTTNISAEEKNNFPYSVGPFITIKGGVNSNGDVPNGIKNGFTLTSMPDFGATCYIPLTQDSPFGLAIDLAYSSYGFGNKYTFQEQNSWKTEGSYLALNPNLYFYGFTIGLNLGIPLGISFDDNNPWKSGVFEIKKEDLQTFFELKIGGMLPLYYDENGRVNLIIELGYFLTPQFKEGEGANLNGSYFEIVPASAALGVSYLFNLSE